MTSHSPSRKSLRAFVLLLAFTLSPGKGTTLAHRWPWLSQSTSTRKGSSPSSSSSSSSEQQQQQQQQSPWWPTLQRRRWLYAWQTATPYSDPDNICSAGATGYRATPGCEGYAYCNNGYMMGGGSEAEAALSIIKCASNQLFDESIGACTDKLTFKCNKPGGSASNIRQPNDSPTTAAAVTARPPSNSQASPRETNNPWETPSNPQSSSTTTNNNPWDTPSNSRPSSPANNNPWDDSSPSSNYNPWEVPNQSPNGGRPRPTRRPTRRPTPRPTPGRRYPTRRPTPRPTPRPQVPSASLLVDSATTATNNNARPPPTTNTRTPRPSRRQTPRPSRWPTKRPVAADVPSSIVWRPSDEAEQPSSPSSQGGGPPSIAWRPADNEPNYDLTNESYLHGSLRDSYYCGARWGDWSTESCDGAVPCPGGFHSECPAGQNCYPRTPCASIRNDAATTTTTNSPTRRPAPSFEFEGDSAKRYCGYGWADVIANCPTAVACPGGFAKGVCPDGMYCIADAPCSDESYIPPSRGETTTQQGTSAAGIGPSPASPPSLALASMTQSRCGNDFDCSDGRVCDVGRMACVAEGEGGGQQQQATSSTRPEGTVVDGGGGSSGADNNMAAYQNPEGNKFFCGDTFNTVMQRCLQSKPCPDAVASIDCPESQGCFFVPVCEAEHSASVATAPDQPKTAPQSTPAAGQPTEMSLNNPTPRPVEVGVAEKSAVESKTNIPVPAVPYKLFQTGSNRPTAEPQKRPTATPDTRPPERANGMPTAPSARPTPPILAVLFPEGINNDGEFNQGSGTTAGGEASQKQHQPGIADGTPPASAKDTIAEFNESSAGVAARGEYQNRPMSTQSQTEPISGMCTLCADSILVPSRRVNVAGNGVRCDRVVSTLSSEGVPEGSELCNNLLAQLDGCCTTMPNGEAGGNDGQWSENETPPETCSLCGDTGLDQSRRVDVDGSVVSCGQIDSSFSDSGIFEGSDRCRNFRGQYFDKCCGGAKQAGDEGGGETDPPDGPDLGEAPPTPAPSTHDTQGLITRQYVSLLAPAATIGVSIWSCCLSIAVGFLVT